MLSVDATCTYAILVGREGLNIRPPQVMLSLVAFTHLLARAFWICWPIQSVFPMQLCRVFGAALIMMAWRSTRCNGLVIDEIRNNCICTFRYAVVTVLIHYSGLGDRPIQWIYNRTAKCICECIQVE
jgi:hypothetical protein